MSHESERIAARAAEYLARSREETPAERREREEWLAEDLRHREVYRQLQQLDERASILLGDPDIRMLTDRDDEESQRSFWVSHRWIWLVVIFVLLIFVAYLLGAFPGP